MSHRPDVKVRYPAAATSRSPTPTLSPRWRSSSAAGHHGAFRRGAGAKRRPSRSPGRPVHGQQLRPWLICRPCRCLARRLVDAVDITHLTTAQGFHRGLIKSDECQLSRFHGRSSAWSRSDRSRWRARIQCLAVHWPGSVDLVDTGAPSATRVCRSSPEIHHSWVVGSARARPFDR